MIDISIVFCFVLVCAERYDPSDDDGDEKVSYTDIPTYVVAALTVFCSVILSKTNCLPFEC